MVHPSSPAQQTYHERGADERRQAAQRATRGDAAAMQIKRNVGKVCVRVQVHKVSTLTMADDMYGSYDAFMSKTVGPAGGDEGMPVDSQYPYREYTRGVGIVFDESFDEYGTKVIVQKLQSGESASKSRMISAGDMIVAVNGVDVSGREIRFLRSLIPGPRKIIAPVCA